MAEGKRHSIWWLMAVICIEALVVILLASSTMIRENTIREVNWVTQELGLETNFAIKRQADEWYQAAVIDTNLEEHIRNLYIPTDEQKRKSRGLEMLGTNEGVWPWVESRIQAFLDLVYWFFRRAALLLMWLPIWIPMFLISIHAGYQNREIKKTDFGYSSPIIHRIAFSAAFGLFLLLLMSFIFPFPVPPVAVPVVLGIITVFLGIAIGNLQKTI